MLPSYWENSPLTVIEAMSLRKIVIAGASGGANDLIKDGFNGFLVEPGDQKMLREKIIFVLSMSHRDIEIMQNRAHDTIKKYFTAGHMVERTISFYSALK